MNPSPHELVPFLSQMLSAPNPSTQHAAAHFPARADNVVEAWQALHNSINSGRLTRPGLVALNGVDGAFS